MQIFKKNIKNHNKKGFTLTEVVLGLLLVGVISVVMVKTTRPQSYDEKGNTLMAFKAMESMSNVFSQVRQTETEIMPAGAFMVKNASGSYEFGVLSTAGGGALANASEIAGLIGDYMKKDGDTINFCTVTGSCSDTNIKGFRLPGDLYVGIEKYANITNCPAFYLPDNKTTQIAAPKHFDGTTKQCWGRIHIDTNGPKPPNTQNEDYYIFGLDEYGIVTGTS